MKVAYMYKLGKGECCKCHCLTKNLPPVMQSYKICGKRNCPDHYTLVHNAPYHSPGQKAFLRISRLPVHDVFYRRINTQCKCRQTICHQVYPEYVDWQQRCPKIKD